MISSLSSGISNVVKDVLGLVHCHRQLCMVGGHSVALFDIGTHGMFL